MSAINNLLFPQLPPCISQYFTDVFYGVEHLLPEEHAVVERSSEKRRADFNTGRYCARQALNQLINAQPLILQGKGRQPLWPDGVVGSISHSEKLVGAVVASQKEITAIGLDIETIGGVNPDMWSMIFHDDERALIRSKQADAGVWATLLFSLKEAFYKMQYPLTEQFLDFLDVNISENDGRLCFSVKNPTINLQSIVLGDVIVKWAMVHDQLLSICYISAKTATNSVV